MAALALELRTHLLTHTWEEAIFGTEYTRPQEPNTPKYHPSFNFPI